MSLFNIPVPNMLNGVSQQTPGLRFATQAEAQENAYSSPVEGLGKRPPTEHVAKLYDGTGSDAFVHVIDRGDGTERYVVVISNGAIKVFDINNNGAEKTVALGTGASSYLGGAANNYKAVSVGDYTFILDRNVTPALDNAVTADRENEALLWVKQGAYGTKYSVTGFFSADFTSAVAGNSSAGGAVDPYNGLVGTSGETFPVSTSTADSSRIASNILSSSLAFTGTVPAGNSGLNWRMRRGTTICIDPIGTTPTIPDPFPISVSDGLGGFGLGLVYKSVRSFSDLPTLARHDMLIEVTGLAESNQDNYWVRFKANDPSYNVQGFVGGVQTTIATIRNISEGVWEEDMAPGIKYKYNYATMPHVLVRLPAGSSHDFIFKRADGLTPAAPFSAPGADLSVAKWTDRVVGDDTSNSAPSFIGNKINDIFLFRGRLGFLAGENIIMSEVSQFFNFWRTTVSTLLDSDPIDIGSSYPAITIFRSAVAFAERLVVFSDQAQFVVSGSPILGPSTATINVVSNYDCLNTPRPAVVGESIFFAFDRGGYSGVREMIANPDDTSLLVAPDISAQIPKYILGKATILAASTHENILAVLSDGAQQGGSNTIYIYKWLNSGNERIQSSWSSWTIRSHPSFAETVRGMAWSKSTLYLVVQRSNSVNLEKITVEPNRKDTYSNFVVCLDRRLAGPGGGQGVTMTYNPATNRTTLSLPTGYRVNDPTKIRVVGRANVTTEAGYDYTIEPAPAVNSTTLSVVGDLTSKSIWIGDAYSTRYEFSTPYLKGNSEGARAAFASGRFQLRNMSLLYSSSAYFKAVVTNKLTGTQYYYPFTGSILGTGFGILGQVQLSDGSFKFPVYGKNDEIKIEIINDSHMPSYFLGAEYESSYVSRTQRF